MLKIEDYHSEQGAIKIVAKIKVTYTTRIEFKTRYDPGFNALQLDGQSTQLNNHTSPWETTAIPRQYFNFNRPRLLTMYGVGLAYNHDEQTLTASAPSQPETGMQPPRNTSARSVMHELSTNLVSSFDINNSAGPSNTPTHINTAQAPLETSTPKSTPIKVKRKSTTAVPKPNKNKKLKITNKILKDTAGVPIFPQYYRITDEGKIAPDTDLDATNEVQVINRQDNAQDQLRQNDPTRDPLLHMDRRRRRIIRKPKINGLHHQRRRCPITKPVPTHHLRGHNHHHPTITIKTVQHPRHTKQNNTSTKYLRITITKRKNSTNQKETTFQNITKHRAQNQNSSTCSASQAHITYPPVTNQEQDLRPGRTER